MTPLETLLAYEGLAATLFSGVYPPDHGVWTRYYSDPGGSPFRWLSPFASFLERLDGSQKTISRVIRFELMKLSGSIGGVSYFPGLDKVPFRQLSKMNFSLKHNLYEERCFGNVPSLFDILRKAGLTFDYNDHGVFDSDAKVFHRAISRPPDRDVMVVRFVDLDTVSHRAGLESAERYEALRRTDFFVENIVAKWRQTEPGLAVMCFADHGMVPVTNYVDIKSYLEKNGLHPFHDFAMFLDSTMARFWGDEKTLTEIRHVLSRLEVGRIVSDETRIRLHIPTPPSFGQLIFLLEPGNAISPSFFDTEGSIQAMHGYDPATPGLDTVFLVHSPTDNHPAGRVARAKMVDVLPTALELLELQVPRHCRGVSLLGS